LDPQRKSYGFGYGSLWSLAGLVHPLAEIVRLRIVFGGYTRPGVRLSSSSTTTGEGVVFAFK
jgi:hypothetical protein